MSSIFAQQTGRSGQLFGAMRSLLVTRHGAGFHAAAATATTQPTVPNRFECERRKRSPMATALRLMSGDVRHQLRMVQSAGFAAGPWASTVLSYSTDAMRKSEGAAPKVAGKGNEAKQQQAAAGIGKSDER